MRLFCFESMTPLFHFPQESARFLKIREPRWKSGAPAKNRQTLLRTFPSVRRGRPPLHNHRSYLCLRVLCTSAKKALPPEIREYKQRVK